MAATGTLLQSVVSPITASLGVLVTASATAHAKGAWVDLITAAANLYGGDLLSILLSDTQATNTDTSVAVDIGVGAAGSEVVVIEGILAGYAGSPNTASGNLPSGRNHIFPFYVEPGVRVAVRCQALIVSDTVRVLAHLMGGSPWGDPNHSRGKWEVYGFSPTTTKGVNTTSGIADVKGLWVEAVASTTREHRYFFCSVHGLDAGLTSNSHFVDIGVGVALSEIVIVPDTGFGGGSSESLSGPYPAYQPLLRPVPAASRIAVRSQSSAAANTDLSIVVHAY